MKGGGTVLGKSGVALTAPKRCYRAGHQPGRYEDGEPVDDVHVSLVAFFWRSVYRCRWRGVVVLREGKEIDRI